MYKAGYWDGPSFFTIIFQSVLLQSDNSDEDDSDEITTSDDNEEELNRNTTEPQPVETRLDILEGNNVNGENQNSVLLAKTQGKFEKRPFKTNCS